MPYFIFFQWLYLLFLGCDIKVQFLSIPLFFVSQTKTHHSWSRSTYKVTCQPMSLFSIVKVKGLIGLEHGWWTKSIPLWILHGKSSCVGGPLQAFQRKRFREAEKTSKRVWASNPRPMFSPCQTEIRQGIWYKKVPAALFHYISSRYQNKLGPHNPGLVLWCHGRAWQYPIPPPPPMWNPMLILLVESSGHAVAAL